MEIELGATLQRSDFPQYGMVALDYYATSAFENILFVILISRIKRKLAIFPPSPLFQIDCASLHLYNWSGFLCDCGIN